MLAPSGSSNPFNDSWVDLVPPPGTLNSVGVRGLPLPALFSRLPLSLGLGRRGSSLDRDLYLGRSCLGELRLYLLPVVLLLTR